MYSNHYSQSQYVNNVSQIVYGCMRFIGSGSGLKSTREVAHRIIDTALESGISIFDLSGGSSQGEVELIFGDALKISPSLRDRTTIQAKFVNKYTDKCRLNRCLGGQRIEKSVEQSLLRLNTDRLDVLMLERSDILIAPDLVFETVGKLIESGKVISLGAINLLLSDVDIFPKEIIKYVSVNQVKINLFGGEAAEEMEGGVEKCHRKITDYFLENNVQFQGGGALCQGQYTGRIDCSKNRRLSLKISQLAAKYQVCSEAIVLGWLMRHPAKIWPVVGTMQLGRIKACSQAKNLNLSNRDWGGIYKCINGNVPY